jgi:glycogen debranching enzyme
MSSGQPEKRSLEPDVGAYYIAATAPGPYTRRALKHGDTFAVFDAHGDIGASPDRSDGLFFRDTRHLSLFALTVNGHQPLLLGSTVFDDNAVLTVDLTNVDMYVRGHLVLPKDTLHIVRTVFLWKETLFVRIGIRNFGDRSIPVLLGLQFESDFYDLFEVRGAQRAARGHVHPTSIENSQVTLRYHGLDGAQRRTTLAFDPAPSKFDERSATFALKLQPGGEHSLLVRASCSPDGLEPATFGGALLAAQRSLRRATDSIGTVETSNHMVNQVLCRSVADLYMLVTDTSEGPYPYAGIPWYSTTFGRDGLLTALMTLWFDPAIAKGVLCRLAALQARADDTTADAQPGKILHEMRDGEMARLGEVPFGLYYGSVDSTPLFVLLAGAYAERTGDLATVHDLWPSVEAALGWIDGPGDADGDGFVEYSTATKKGLTNQGWKDSQDAVFHSDGSLANGPIALAEVQGYVYAAKRAAAKAARAIGKDEVADRLEDAARKLARRFEESFWSESLGTYALALDGAKRRCEVRTSNAGQVLFSGIANVTRARKVADLLLEPSHFSGWGVRTLHSGEPRYNPMSYHNGSVWPHDNALISYGFARYELKDHAGRLFDAIFEAAGYMDVFRLPELYCGFRRRRRSGPTLYPVACSPQAWASAAPFALVQACTGLEFDVPAREIRFRKPQLPASVHELVLKNLTLGTASVDVAFRHRQGHLSTEVLRRVGDVEVAVIL